ncbi:hypothetical protein D3C78_1846420 [compost metagenome]
MAPVGGDQDQNGTWTLLFSCVERCNYCAFIDSVALIHPFHKLDGHDLIFEHFDLLDREARSIIGHHLASIGSQTADNRAGHS